MYNNINIPELVTIITLSVVLIVTLIAIFNFDWLNNAIFQFHNAIEKKYSKTKSGLGRFILSFYKYPGEFPKGIKHDGWRSGFTFLTSTISTLLLGGFITIIGIAVYYIVMAVLAIAIAIVVIVVVIAIIGAVLGNS